ncbi:trigger factor [Parachlamydia sp. AcF125]|uniref:trigger factor n=1 Tax=Parachlamydia sp. AcF125 TaxID=2795736 RepID=UPI001BC9186E|nr:Trigger factor [Parachlamydia sp. AcF125]
MSNNQTEVSNEHVKISLRKEDGCLVKLDVHVTPQATQAAYQEAIKVIAKEVSMPGFRKGKVPQAMILQNFNSHVEKEWRDILLNRALREFMEMTRIYPFTKESVQKALVKNAPLEAGADLVIEFESAPAIPEVDPQSLELKPVEKKEITQADVDKAIENVRVHYADWKVVGDRAVQEGDTVVVDACSVENPEQVYYANESFKVDEQGMAGWFKAAIIGHQTGESVEAQIADQEPPMHMRITIKEIKTPILPELNDELAKKSGAESLEDMRNKMQDQLNKHAEEERKFELREQIPSLLLEKYPFEVPASIAKQEMKRLIAAKTEELKETGLSAAEASKKIEEMRPQIEKECVDSIRMIFLENDLIQKFKVQVSDEEVFRELFTQVYRYSQSLPDARGLLNSPEMHNRVRQLLMSKKVKDFLVEQAQKN